MSSSIITYDRFQVTPAMKATLKSYILKQRQKKKEEEEQDAVFHRERKIREIKRQQDTATLEQTNGQVTQLEQKLETLKKEKHDLFTLLKRVLHQEQEQRQRMMQMQIQHDKEKSEVLAKVGGGLQPNLLLPGASPPQQPMLPKPLTIAGSSPGQAVPPAIATKRPRSPSPQTPAVVGQSPQNSSGFLSPKRSTPPYQRSPYQPSSGSIFTPRVIPPADSNRFFQQMSTIQTPVVVAAPFNRLPMDLNPRSPHYDVRPVAPQATHLPARIPQHVPPVVSIPILPPHQKMGSITSGFPLHRPAVNPLIKVPPTLLQYGQKSVPEPQTFLPPHQRM